MDYLAEEPTEYSLFATPTNIQYHENVLGEFVPNDIQEADYVFASQEFFGPDDRQNIDNFGFYQDVIAWVIEQNANRNFPVIREGTVRSIVPTLTQSIVSADAESARYQIQLKITYKRI